MAARKKNKTKTAPKKSHNPGTAASPNARGAVDVRLKHLERGRIVRGREAGDGGGVDIGISPGAFSVSIERHLKGLKPENKERLLKHMREKVDEVMKPLRKLIQVKGSNHELNLLNDVGPNMFRTIIEYLEGDESK